MRTTPMQPAAFRDYKWIVRDRDLLGGQPTVRGTRLSVSFVLSCLAAGMTAAEIRETYGVFPEDAIPEVLRLASQALDGLNVAA